LNKDEVSPGDLTGGWRGRPGGLSPIIARSVVKRRLIAAIAHAKDG
jgi:hypothetical protein